MQSLDRYLAFFTAAKYENFSRAANELMVSQSAISQAIRQLEDALGVQLFLRSGRKVRLSSDGRFLKDRLQPIFQQLDQTERQLLESQDPEQARLILGASDTLCRHYLLSAFAAFHEHYPLVQLEIINAPSPEIARLIREHQIDVGFVHGRPQDFSDLSTQSLRTVEEVFFASRSPNLKKLSYHELLQQPFVGLTKRSATRQLLDDYFQAETTGWKPQVEVISIDLMIDLVRSGFGISYTHRDLIQSEDLIIIDVPQPITPRDLLVLQPKTRYPSRTLEQFEKFLERV